MHRKFIFFNDSNFIEEFTDYCDRFVYIQQDYEKFSRLVIWPNNNAIETLTELIKGSSAPYEMLYILRTSRCNNEEARYKQEGLTLDKLQEFLESFHAFLEYDSRHRLVIRSSDEKLTYFVFDEAYGNVEQFKSILHSLGFEEYDKPIIHPDPHMHMYHENLDIFEEKILNYFPWKKGELQTVDQ